MENLLNLTLASEYDLVVERGRTLNASITCTYIDASGNTNYFDFSSYTGATMMVKNNAGTIITTFSTTNGSILLQSNGVFKFIKTDTEMLVLRAGCYNYDMYISSATYPKRGFLTGRFIVNQNITN